MVIPSKIIYRSQTSTDEENMNIEQCLPQVSQVSAIWVGIADRTV